MARASLPVRPARMRMWVTTGFHWSSRSSLGSRTLWQRPQLSAHAFAPRAKAAGSGFFCSWAPAGAAATAATSPAANISPASDFPIALAIFSSESVRDLEQQPIIVERLACEPLVELVGDLPDQIRREHVVQPDRPLLLV